MPALDSVAVASTGAQPHAAYQERFVLPATRNTRHSIRCTRLRPTHPAALPHQGTLHTAQHQGAYSCAASAALHRSTRGARTEHGARHAHRLLLAENNAVTRTHVHGAEAGTLRAHGGAKRRACSSKRPGGNEGIGADRHHRGSHSRLPHHQSCFSPAAASSACEGFITENEIAFHSMIFEVAWRLQWGEPCRSGWWRATVAPRASPRAACTTTLRM